VLGYALATANWSTNADGPLSKLNLKFNPGSLFNSYTFMAIIAVNVALGLILLDSFLRRKQSAT
jgi:hypothetical protein